MSSRDRVPGTEYEQSVRVLGGRFAPAGSLRSCGRSSSARGGEHTRGIPRALQAPPARVQRARRPPQAVPGTWYQL